MTDSTLLQVCPNDHPPFLDICAVYQAAAASIGRNLVTVFLSSANAEPLPGAVYLNCATLRNTVRVAAAFDAELASARSGPPAVELGICHRYRAYRVFRASGWSASATLVVAHEFGFFDRWRRRMDQKLHARGVRFAGVSAPVVDELARAVKQPLLMPNGIDVDRAAASRLERTQALAVLNLREQHFNIGVVGRLHPKKQPQLALSAMACVRQALPDAHLVFIGDGELKAELQASAEKQSVSFAGFVAEAARHFNALDVLLIPSGEREAFSMVALEAMAAGVPVVAGPTPGPHFVLGDVGYYFTEFTAEDLAAAVISVHRDRGRSGERMRRGITRAERDFSVAAIAKRLQILL
ncbi:MAG: glycosyltransferase family 4 protein [Gammaproteobacteria bacterium]|nr:glycosyltransferase family 4 protein [Gammaproteobacteria bacterium]